MSAWMEIMLWAIQTYSQSWPNSFISAIVGDAGDSPAWAIIIPKLDFQSQMKISQQNKRLADVVNVNAEHELRKFRGHIRENKYMWVFICS